MFIEISIGGAPKRLRKRRILGESARIPGAKTGNPL
jgi:hypothetical protein